MQLVAYGAQDVYLTGNPQITFFKVVYRRHTNFSIEAITQTFSGSPGFGRDVSVQITRNGDLITNMYLMVRLPAITGLTGEQKMAWSQFVGHAIIREVELDIGGSRIDRQYGDWLNVWYELTLPTGQSRGYDHLVGNNAAMTDLTSSKNVHQLYVPLQFFCNRHDGLALPLISLQYHEVRLNFKFRALSECIVTCDSPNITGDFQDAQLLVDYIYLDSEERKRFAQASHEYLIEQIQFTGDESVSNISEKYRLSFNHPSKFILWALRLGRYTTGKCFLAYNSNDWVKAQDLATKRFILNVASRTADAGGTGNTEDMTSTGIYLDVSSNDTEVDGVLTLGDSSNVSGNVMTIWNAITKDGTELPRLIDDGDNQVLSSGGTRLMTLDNIIYCEPIPMQYMSYPTGSSTNEVFQGAATGSLIAAGTYTDVKDDNDCCVYDHKNYGLHLNREHNPTNEAQIQLNGHDRFQKRDGNYFNFVQPYQHFANTPQDGINVYSFALNPEDHQPSGTVNFSRIDNTQLNIDFSAPAGEGAIFKSVYAGDLTKISIYTMNYNVLRVMSGMGGLAYSN